MRNRIEVTRRPDHVGPLSLGEAGRSKGTFVLVQSEMMVAWTSVGREVGGQVLNRI